MAEAQVVQFQKRERRIGSYDIAALVGQSPFGGPIDVFRRIVEGEKKEQTKAMRRGQLLEPAIRQMYLDETGAEVLPLANEGIIYSSRHPFMVCQVDALVERHARRRTADFKAPHPELAHKWGESGTDEVDPVTLIQGQWIMECMDGELHDVVPYFGGDDLRIYTLHRDVELINMLLEVAAKFWRDHVQTGKPPPPDATASYGEWIEKKFPINRGNYVQADFDAEIWAEKLFAARAAKEAAEEQEQLARNHLQQLIAGHDGIDHPAWRINWKQQKGRASTDWEAIAREAGVPEDLIQKHTRIGEPYRVFRPTLKKAKKAKEQQ